jgi:small subunit ribosomal protein S21
MAYNNYNSKDALVCTGSKVYVVDGKFEQAMRKFKNKVQDSGLLIELREREAYEKPTTKRKRALAQAKKRWQKKLAHDTIPKKLY